MEQYAESMDLLIWTSSYILPTPQYDETTHSWSVTVSRNGQPVELKVKHIILATGTLGKPNFPDLPGLDTFRGELLRNDAVTPVLSSGIAIAPMHRYYSFQAPTDIIIINAPNAIPSTMMVL